MLRYEAELEGEEKTEEFKSQLFTNNLKLYRELYGTVEEQIHGPETLTDEEIEFPETPAEFKAMVASMQRHGVLGAEQGDQYGQAGNP